MNDKFISVSKFKQMLANLDVKGFTPAVKKGIEIALNDAVPQLLDDEPAADVQPAPQWISVKDRLPDKDGNYLCYLECGDVCQSVFDSTIASEGEKFPFGEWVGVYNSDTLGFADSYWEEYDAVTHWMPMPEPPKEGDTECQ